MSDVDRQSATYFLDWIKQGGVAQWIQHFLDAGDEAKLREIKGVYDKTKAAFGFQKFLRIEFRFKKLFFFFNFKI